MDKKTIGILYLCTGPYSLFWEDYYTSFEKNFLRDFEKHYYVFTDRVEGINTFGSDKVKVIKIDPLPWPLITLLRFNYFLSIEEKIKDYDFLMFSNANMICVKEINEEEFLPRDSKNEKMSFVLHPGHFKEAKYNHPYERKKKSLAYIPYNCGGTYVIGAMFGGKTSEFLKMSHILKGRIENDLKRNVIASWHDESHMNRYIVGHDDFRILDPSYCYPVGFDLPYEKKISGVSKMAKFNVKEFKGTEEKPKNIYYYFEKIAKKIKSDGTLRFIRDSLFFKHIEKL